MANLFLPIPVPSANGPGAAVNISAFGWIKSFSIEGTLVGNVTLEMSNDAVTWAPIATLSVPGDICTSFAAVWVRANVGGFVQGAAVLAVGGDDSGTLTTPVPVLPGNGTGAPVNIAAFGQKKTVLYSGGPMYTDLTVIVEISEDGVAFSELITFSGPVPASKSFECSIEAIRTTVVGFVAGVVTVSVTAVQDSSSAVSLQDAYNASTGIPVTITLSPALGGIVIVGVPGVPDPLFAVIDNLGNPALTVQSDPATAVVVRNIAMNDGGTAAFFEGDAGSTAPVSAASTGRIRYDETTNRWQVSENGGAYVNLDGMTTLQEAYDNSTGVPVDIQLAVVRGGIRILDVAAQTTPSFEVSSSASAQDSIMVTRTFAGAGIGIDVSMSAASTGVGINVSHVGSGAALQATASGSGLALNVTTSGTGQQASFTNVSDTATISTTFFRVPTVATGGTNLRLSDNGNFTGFLFELLHTGTGTGIQFVHSAGAGTSFNLNRSPGVVTAGVGLQIIYGANTTGTMVNLSQAGSGIAFNLQSTGVGTTLQVGATGVSASTAIIFSASNSPTFNTSNTAATAVIANAFNRLPAAPIGGSILRLSSNVNFTGIGLEIISGAAAGSDTGINVVMRGSGIGCVLHDQAANAHTGILLRLQHDITGSTGLLLEMLKRPAAATAGDFASIIVGGNASGNIWAVTHDGSGDYESISMTGAGRYLSLTHTGAGEVWRIIGPAALVLSVMTTGGLLQHVAGSAAAPSMSFTLSTATGFFRSAADIIGVSVAGTERFQFTSTGTGEFIPPADNAGSVGSAARRFALVRAVTITSGDLAFEDEVCPRCKKEFQVEDEIVLKVHRIARDEAGRRVSYSVPQHASCPHA